MNKVKNILKVGVFAAFLAVVATAPAMASISSCVGQGNKYPELSTVSDPTNYPIKCQTINEDNGAGGTTQVTLYGKNMAACSQAGSLATNPEQCSGDDLNTIVRTIINTVIFVVGMLAVVMIILGGVSYATSQGDPNKVNKAKSTIMYGIIGLVICLLAFAIVNFVVSALAG